VYFGKAGIKVVLLLSGGDKRSQERDIKKALDYWADYMSRDHEKE
jgi:putative addiction module killer protein